MGAPGKATASLWNASRERFPLLPATIHCASVHVLVPLRIGRSFSYGTITFSTCFCRRAARLNEAMQELSSLRGVRSCTRTASNLWSLYTLCLCTHLQVNTSLYNVHNAIIHCMCPAVLTKKIVSKSEGHFMQAGTIVQSGYNSELLKKKMIIYKICFK